MLCLGKTFKFSQKNELIASKFEEDMDLVEVEDGKRISAFEVYEKKRKKKGHGKEKEKPEKEGNQNPVRLLKEMAKKFGVKNMVKR